MLERKAALRELMMASSPSKLHYSDHFVGRGQDFFRASCAKGLEGIVSKPGNEAYCPGRRDRWCKIKCGMRQEFVVGGWLPREGDERDLGALLVGYFDRGKLLYAGSVGTGFSTKTRADVGQSRQHKALIESLTEIKRDTDPFAETPRVFRKRVRWAEPRTVVEVGFTEFTSDGLLRHPTFKGVREDKSAEEVGLEVPGRFRRQV